LYPKSRGSAYEHEWTDAVRGVTKAISSDSTNTESTDSTGLTAFGADGFTVGADTNYSDTTGSGMVAWNWLAGGATTVTNTTGDIESEVSANTTAGFSILSYTGTGVAGDTVGHGLSEVPELWIIKRLDNADWWAVGSTHGIDATKYLALNTTAAPITHTTVWNDTAPTASVLSFGTAAAVNSSSGIDDYIAYVFHSVEGYSKVGSYEGNGNADGTFVQTGNIQPTFVLIKDTTAAEDWVIHDTARSTYNQSQKVLYPNTSGAEEDSSGRAIDIVSNGFKVRNNGGRTNRNGDIYIYLVIGHPFKTSNAR